MFRPGIPDAETSMTGRVKHALRPGTTGGQATLGCGVAGNLM